MKLRIKLTTIIILILQACIHTLYAQKGKYDIVSYMKPAGWSGKKGDGNYLMQKVNNKTGTYAMIAIYESVKSTGSISSDFSSAWQKLIMEPLKVNNKVAGQSGTEIGNFKTLAGSSAYDQNGKPGAAMLMTFSNTDIASNIIVLTNTSAFDNQIASFVHSISLTEPGAQKSTGTNVTLPQSQNTPPPAAHSNGKFAFTTTNFNDGWTSTEQPDWVESHKGKITVLIHYPRAEDKNYVSQQADNTTQHWNTLVAPRYSNLQHFELYQYNMDAEPAHFAAGDLTDSKTGKICYVALFQKAKSNWMEIITPDRNTFVQQFKVDHPDSWFSDWGSLSALEGLNKFAVAASDLNGKWTNNFSGTTVYENAYTGATAAVHTYASTEHFTFSGDHYDWLLAGGNTVNGVTDSQTGKGNGSFSMKGNWQIQFSNIAGKPRLYNAYFTCIKGARLLWLQDTGYGGYTAYGRVE